MFVIIYIMCRILLLIYTVCSFVLRLACACHSFHYTKRLMETVFVHRFSRGTMPLRTIVRVRMWLPLHPNVLLLCLCCLFKPLFLPLELCLLLDFLSLVGLLYQPPALYTSM